MPSQPIDPDLPDPFATLSAFGWSAHWAAAFAHQPSALAPARVIEQHLTGYVLATCAGEREGRVSGAFLDGSPEAHPAVGDWVAIEAPTSGSPAIISAVLQRRSCLIRPAAGKKPQLQAIAANVDIALLVCSLDHDFNLSRLERYLVGMADTGAELLLVLNKTDLHPDPEAARAETAAIAGSTPVLLASARAPAGLDELRARLSPGVTVAFVGSSGVGKSTLVNALLGQERQATQAVRVRDHGGQHTTTSRQLLAHADGWLLIDTPGMRQLRLFYETANIDSGFPDLTELATRCRFRDCTHAGEPGCAIAQAIDHGEIEPRRLENFKKIVRELEGRARFEKRHAHAVQRRLDRERATPRRTGARSIEEDLSDD